jgi:zinc D-Ala-D-Ala carboxypeptidase
MMLSPHFSLAEFVVSETAARKGLDNTPPADAVANLRRVAMGLEGVRILLGVPIIIKSGYRSVALNRAVGGARTSQHITGHAADFLAPGFGGPRHIADRMIQAGIEFDQCIVEFPNSPGGGWLHCSFVQQGARHHALIIDADGARPLYA